jgi:hypothetical protein
VENFLISNMLHHGPEFSQTFIPGWQGTAKVEREREREISNNPRNCEIQLCCQTTKCLSGEFNWNTTVTLTTTPFALLTI